jgi:hypothetical protein
VQCGSLLLPFFVTHAGIGADFLPERSSYGQLAQPRFISLAPGNPHYAQGQLYEQSYCPK